jgi:lysophospholipid acyltransferase (LPLAT)-like uncharacterized protein
MPVRSHFCRPDSAPFQATRGERFIYAIWHEDLLFPVYYFRRANIAYLIGQHADGQVLAEVGRHLRVPLVRGSSTRGRVEAMRQMLRVSGRRHIAIATDGPRGPRGQVQPGVVYVAALTGMGIVPTGFGFRKPWRLRSWDRMAVPRPWHLTTHVGAEPIYIPGGANKRELQQYRQMVEEKLHWASGQARLWAESGVAPFKNVAA